MVRRMTFFVEIRPVSSGDLWGGGRGGIRPTQVNVILAAGKQ